MIGKTLRLQIIGWDKVEAVDKGKIFSGWHGRTIIPANHFKGRGYYCLVSLSRDGEMQSRIFTKFGFNIIRGSSGRGGERALIESIRVLRKGGSMAMTPDGPRGPSEVVQGGVMMMARKSGAALIPVGSTAKRAWYAPTWDNYLVPKPFSKAVFAFGDPIYVPSDADDALVEELRLKLEEETKAIQKFAEDTLGVVPPPIRRKARPAEESSSLPSNQEDSPEVESS